MYLAYIITTVRLIYSNDFYHKKMINTEYKTYRDVVLYRVIPYPADIVQLLFLSAYMIFYLAKFAQNLIK